MLDEVEKAHPDVFNLLLQALDDGHMTIAWEEKLISNTIIIMTSNIGSRQLKEFGQGVGFGTTAKIANANNHAKGVIEKHLKKLLLQNF